ncbi:MAG: hypothetical protein ACFFCJ_10850, partial [Promethearchaeota archaeon]
MKKNRLSLLMLFIVLFASQFITYSQIPPNELSAKSETTPIHNPSINSLPLPGALDPLWTKTFGGAGREESPLIIDVGAGGYAILGTKDTGAINARDFWLIRTDANGNELWNQTYGGTGWDVARNLVEVSTGGFALIGYTESYGAGAEDIWLVRVDAAGNHLWNTTFGGSGDDSIVYAFVEASTGGFAIAAGTTKFTSGDRDAWLIRTDASGNELWNQTYGGPQDDWGDWMVEASGGGFTLLCTTSSFGAGGQDNWLIHTDASGNHLWNQTYGWIGNEVSACLIEISGGGYAFTSITRSFEPYGDAWFVRTDALGSHLWNQTFSYAYNDVLAGIAELTNGEFALAGWSTSFGSGERDLWVVRTDASGNLYWHHTYGGSQPDFGLIILEVSGGGFIVAGETASYGGG